LATRETALWYNSIGEFASRPRSAVARKRENEPVMKSETSHPAHSELSIVSPIFGAEHSLLRLHERLSAAAAQVTDRYELVLVEDCSPDGSWGRLRELAERDVRVKAIRLTRNFGQQNAIAAGLAHASGRRIVVIDCDLQDQPEKIPAMWAKADEGFDIVFTLRRERKDSIQKRVFSWMFYTLMGMTGKGFLRPGIGTFSLISRDVRDSYLRVADEHSLYVAVLHWLGYESTVIEQLHSERDSGKSGYSFRKLVHYAINGLVTQSNTLLHMSIMLGFGLVLLSFGGIVYLIVRKLTNSVEVTGWASLAVLNLAVGGAIMLSLGVLGLYIGRIFEQVRGRPLFLVRERINAPTEPPPEGE
jgi:dolichol-phosphate mannosyltransferase